MPTTLPADIAKCYCPATDIDVRAESFGLLTAARINAEEDWHKQRRTFDDQAIFGPVRDYKCAYGKYSGRGYAGIICDLCGVKLDKSNMRRSRCAHLNLTEQVLHPIGNEPSPLHILPVLPVAFVEAPAGAGLLLAYDSAIKATTASEISVAFNMLLDVLSPLLVTAHNWNLSDRLLIAWGMALTDASR